MGFGDEIMATGMARGAKDRGKRIAFGDGQKIIYSPWSEQVFRNNPNIARPGEERAADIEWIAHYKGHRLYNHHVAGRWIWHMDFRAVPGEIFFSASEKLYADSILPGFILIEPNVPAYKTVAVNKQWPADRFQKVCDLLLAQGHRVVQLKYRGASHRLKGADMIETQTFRDALAVLSRAALYIGPEGGMHHGAAALDVPAIVLFGGFIPPAVTGYATHTNLTGGAQACGNLQPCLHCKRAMAAIGVEKVMKAVRRRLGLSGVSDDPSAETVVV